MWMFEISLNYVFQINSLSIVLPSPQIDTASKTKLDSFSMVFLLLM